MNSIIYYIPLAYIIGSIPTAVWLGKLLYGVDVRKQGSGNAGATNTMRTLGKTPGIVVLIIDIGKGILSSSLPFIGNQLLNIPLPHLPHLNNISLLTGIIAAIGHIYPIFAQFKGGKGVATLFGVIIGIDYRIALICLAVFLVEFIIFRWVSLGSMIASLAFGLVYLIFYHPYTFIDNLLVFVYPTIIIFTHRQNIIRLLKGTEPKLNLKQKK